MPKSNFLGGMCQILAYFPIVEIFNYILVQHIFVYKKIIVGLLQGDPGEKGPPGPPGAVGTPPPPVKGCIYF